MALGDEEKTSKTCFQCQFCKHSMGCVVCPAYPGGIPSKIITGQIMHDEVLPDQEGDYVFLPPDDWPDNWQKDEYDDQEDDSEIMLA